MIPIKSPVRFFLILTAVAVMAGATAALTGCKHMDSDMHSGSAHAGKYSCAMHPEVAYDTRGKCPKCGMDLVKKD